MLSGQVGIEVGPGLALDLSESMLEEFSINPQDDLAEHLDKTPVGVIREALVRCKVASPSTVSSLRPRLRTVSIMPGIENFAPDLTETRSGFEGVAEISFRLLPRSCGSAFQNLVPHPLRKFLSRAVVGITGLGRDRKPRWYRQPGISHLRQAGAFAAQKILHIAAPVGMAFGKEIDILVRHSAHPTDQEEI